MTMEPFEYTGQPDWDWWGRLWPAPGETLREFDFLTKPVDFADLQVTLDKALRDVGVTQFTALVAGSRAMVLVPC